MLFGLYALYGSENKQRLFPYTALTDWFVLPRWSVYCAVRTAAFNIIRINLRLELEGQVNPHSIL